MLTMVIDVARHHFLATKLFLAFAITMGTKSMAEPVDDVMDICTRLADNTLERVAEFKSLGWKRSDDPVRAAIAMADSSALVRQPERNTEEGWEDHLTSQFQLQEYANWPYIMELGDSFVFLGDIAPTNYENFATCALATRTTQRTADIFSEAEALGTLTYENGVYQGRISRTTRYDDENGWISVVLLAAVGPDAKLPRKVEASTRLTFINAPLRD